MYFRYYSRIDLVVDDLEMAEFYLRWATEFAVLAKKHGKKPLLDSEVLDNLSWSLRYLDNAMEASMLLGADDHKAFFALFDELWAKRKEIMNM